jgi:hypothetical protein
MTIEPTTPPELEPGKTYRAAIITNTSMGFAPSIAKIQAKLQEIGFTDVQVWDNEVDLPEDWPREDWKDVSDTEQAQYWGRGVWAGEKTSNIPTKGKDWWLIRMQAEGSDKKFEQQAGSSPYAWIPTVMTIGMLGAVVWLWASGSKER